MAPKNKNTKRTVRKSSTTATRKATKKANKPSPNHDRLAEYNQKRKALHRRFRVGMKIKYHGFHPKLKGKTVTVESFGSHGGVRVLAPGLAKRISVSPFKLLKAS